MSEPIAIFHNFRTPVTLALTLTVGEKLPSCISHRPLSNFHQDLTKKMWTDGRSDIESGFIKSSSSRDDLKIRDWTIVRTMSSIILWSNKERDTEIITVNKRKNGRTNGWMDARTDISTNFIRSFKKNYLIIKVSYMMYLYQFSPAIELEIYCSQWLTQGTRQAA